MDDQITYAIWIAQGIVLIAILLRDGWHRDWMRIVGAAVGLAVGVLPIALPGLIPSGAFFFHLFFAPVVLTVAYGLGRRWVAFILALAFLPLVGIAFPEIFLILFELYFYYSPTVTALAGREVFACIESYRSKERTA